MEKFYAMYDDDFNQVAVFDTLEERDAWCRFDDDFSRQIGDLDQWDSVRLPIETDLARAICGENLTNYDCYYEDEVSGICFIKAA